MKSVFGVLVLHVELALQLLRRVVCVAHRGRQNPGQIKRKRGEEQKFWAN